MKTQTTGNISWIVDMKDLQRSFRDLGPRAGGRNEGCVERARGHGRVDQSSAWAVESPPQKCREVWKGSWAVATRETLSEGSPREQPPPGEPPPVNMSLASQERGGGVGFTRTIPSKVLDPSKPEHPARRVKGWATRWKSHATKKKNRS